MKSSRNLSLDYKAGSLGGTGRWLCREVMAFVMKFLKWESFPNIITTIIHNKFKEVDPQQALRQNDTDQLEREIWEQLANKVKLPSIVSGVSASKLAKAPIPVSDNHRMVNRILADLIFLIKLNYMHPKTSISTPPTTTKNKSNLSPAGEGRIKMEKFGQSASLDNKIVCQIAVKNKSRSLQLRKNKTSSCVVLDQPITFKQRNRHKTSRSLTELEKNSSVRFDRDEKIAFYLSPQLEKFSDEHKLREKKPQIRYVNTLKKVKMTGLNLGCSVRAKTQGIELQLSQDLQKEANSELRYTLRKQFDRFLRKKIVKESNHCSEQAANFSTTLQNHKKQMDDCLKINEKERSYKGYDVSRFQSYLKGKSTKQLKYNFYIKKQIEQKLNKVNEEQRLQNQKSEDTESLWDTRRNTFYSSSNPNSPSSRKFSYNEEVESLNSSPKITMMSRMDQFKEDLIQFLQICEFYKKIQHELLRYLPNNHIANKVNTVISQVEHGTVIKKIYDKCDTDITQITPNKIITILKNYPGILSTMNYIVNIIKLNISAERRKRFVDVEKTIGKFTSIIAQRKEEVCNKIKVFDNPQLKRSIQASLLKTKVECSGMNPSYTQFVRQGQQQQFSQINTFKNRRTICQILKFQSLMR